MHIAIVDDEKFFREEIFNLLTLQYPKHTIDTFENTTELLNSRKVYNLVLLDIELPEEDGVTFAKKHRHLFPYVIFVTSHNDMMHSSFCSNVYGFVRKDCLEKDLFSAINEFERLILDKTSIMFNTQNGSIEVYEDDILYFHFCDESIYMHTNQKTTRIFETSLLKVENKLTDIFFRIDRNYIVNLKYIVEVKRGVRSVLLQNNEIFYITEKRWNEFKAKYAWVRGERHGKPN